MPFGHDVIKVKISYLVSSTYSTADMVRTI